MQAPTALSQPISGRLSELTKPVEDLEEGVLVSATYDGEKRVAVLKFYDPRNDVIRIWHDNTGHRPYCVEGDTILLGDNKTIAHIHEGDQTLGLTGEVAVEGKSVRTYQGRMITIHASGLLPFNITPEHPVLTVRSQSSGHGRLSRFADPRWTLPRDLRPKLALTDGDYLVFPISKGRYETNSVPLGTFSKRKDHWVKVSHLPINEEIAWLLGLYVAEGSSGGRRGAVFSLNENESAILDRVKRVARCIGYSTRQEPGEGKGVRLHLGGAVIARAIENWCGGGADRKRIPDFILFHKNIAILRAFMEGYTSGDGSLDFTRNTTTPHRIQTMSSVSKLLILQLQQAYARLGVFAHIKLQHGAGEYVIEGRTVSQNEAFTISFLDDPKYTHAKRVGDAFYVPIRRVESVKFSGTVYNIQTSDNTYLVNNALVHNCYTKLPRDQLGEVRARKDILEILDEERLDLLADKRITVRKIIATDPLAIGGTSGNSVRDMIDAWEADIKYYENFIYDRGLQMGTYYQIKEGEILPIAKELPDAVARSLGEILSRSDGEASGYIRRWAELLGQPLFNFKRIALDIEVANEENRIPDPEKADRELLAISLYNDSEKIVYLLSRNDMGESFAGKDFPYRYQLYPDEASLLRAVFAKLLEYPVLITFNGDDFDLRYVKHRAEKVGIKEAEIPIQLQRQEASLKHGLHIDLYRFFNSRAIQVYVYGNRYAEHTLNGVAEALLNKSKLDFEGNIASLPLSELANYCLNDSQLTFEFTSVNDSVLMKILLVISRIARIPMNDVARLGVSNWLRSMLFYEHRRIGALIPRQNELAEKGGASSEATIKGKKYKGGLVIEPKPGVHFGVSVLDFASLYPSLIKVYNLSYETVNCPHEDDRSNLVPGTTHWVCRKRKGMTSLLLGSLRDLRVSHYKPLVRDPKLGKDEKELYNVVSQGLKVILNAGYGVMGFETFALYCLPVAEATAALGRYAITKTIDKCHELGINVIYSDSVTGERCVTLMNPAGEVVVEPVEAFFNRFSEVIIRRDTKEEAYPTGWKTISLNQKTGETDWKEIKAVIRHRNDGKRIYRIWDKFGSTRVTEDHSLVASMNDGKRVLSRPQEMAGKHLLRAGRVPGGKPIDTIDMYQILKSVQYGVLYKRRSKTLQAHCDHEWVWFGWTNRKNPIKLRRYVTVGSREFIALVELLGAYIPEGSSSTPETTNSRMGASICCSDTQWLEKQKQNLGVLFSNTAHSLVESQPELRDLTYQSSSGKLVQVQYKDNTFKLQMMNEISAVFFKAFCGQKSSGKHLPDFIFNTADEYKLLLLENMVKGDGSRVFGKAYSDDYRSRNFKYESKSLRLISGLSTLLLQLGINHSVGYRPSKKTHSIATSTSHNRTQRVPRVIEENYEGYVYDLSVDDYHTFVDSCGSIVLKNTDSLFLENPTREQIKTVADWAEKELGVELDLDKTYRYVAFSERKKNYFGVLSDGTPEIKGLTGKKSMTPEFLKKTFYESLEILGKVYGPPDFERARTNIRELLTQAVAKLRNRQVPIDDLSFNVMIGKTVASFSSTTPQHVKAAQLLMDKGREIKAGDIISYVKTKNPPYVKPTALARPEDIDVDKYLDYAKSMFDQILDGLGFNFDEIMGGTTLDLFWS